MQQKKQTGKDGRRVEGAYLLRIRYPGGAHCILYNGDAGWGVNDHAESVLVIQQERDDRLSNQAGEAHSVVHTA